MRGLLSLMVLVVTGCTIEKHYHDDDDADWGDDTALTTPPSSFDGSDGGEDEGSDDDGGSDVPDTGGGSDDIDVTGSYNVQVAAATGCGGEAFWLEDWVRGPMRISGESGALTFDFLEGMEFSGAVDSSRTYSFAGEVEFTVAVHEDTGATTRMARLEAQNSGTFTLDGNCWVREGTFILQVDENNDGLEFNDCTVSAPVKATQISGGACNGLG